MAANLPGFFAYLLCQRMFVFIDMLIVLVSLAYGIGYLFFPEYLVELSGLKKL